MSETFIFTCAGEEDLNLGHGPFSSLIPDGTTATLHKIGIQSILGAAFLNANDQDGATAGDQIDAADAVLADGIGVIVLPPLMASGEATTIPDTTTLFDFRGGEQGIGFRFNLSAENNSGTRSKLFIADDYSATQTDLDFAYTLDIRGSMEDAESATGTLAAVNIEQSINSQGADFTGNLIGIRSNALATSTNTDPWAVAAAIGGSFMATASGNTSVVDLIALVAAAPANGGTGTVTNAIAFKAEAVPSIGSAVNLSILAEGFTELVDSVGIGVLPNPDIGLLVEDAFDFSLFIEGLSQFQAPIGIGVAPNAAVGVSMGDVGLTGGSQYGLQIAVLSSVDAISAGVGIMAQCDTAVGSFTQAANYSIYAKNPTRGAGSTITTLYGVYIEPMTVGGTNYGLYSAHTGESVFSGRVSGTSMRLTAVTPTSGIAANEIGLGRSTLTNIGANGAASAPTANPLGYLKINIAGTLAQIPYYNIA